MLNWLWENWPPLFLVAFYAWGARWFIKKVKEYDKWH